MASKEFLNIFFKMQKNLLVLQTWAIHLDFFAALVRIYIFIHGFVFLTKL